MLEKEHHHILEWYPIRTFLRRYSLRRAAWNGRSKNSKTTDQRLRAIKRKEFEFHLSPLKSQGMILRETHRKALRILTTRPLCTWLLPKETVIVLKLKRNPSFSASRSSAINWTGRNWIVTYEILLIFEVRDLITRSGSERQWARDL